MFGPNLSSSDFSLSKVFSSEGITCLCVGVGGGGGGGGGGGLSQSSELRVLWFLNILALAPVPN